MKKTKSIWTLLLTLVLLCSLSALAYAESSPEPIDPPALVESLQETFEPMNSLPEEEVEVSPESSDTSKSVALEEQETEVEATPTQEKSNTPYYVGAVLAALLFAGVAAYCKCKGNR